MLKLFRHALHFAMRRDEDLIDRCRIEHAVSFGYLLDDSDGFVIAQFAELDERRLTFLTGLRCRVLGSNDTIASEISGP